MNYWIFNPILWDYFSGFGKSMDSTNGAQKLVCQLEY